MKSETTRSARKCLPRRKRSQRSEAEAGGSDLGRRPEVGVDQDFDPIEFAEFLEADDGPIPIDPAFRERLREQLWEIVRDRATERRPHRPRRTP